MKPETTPGNKLSGYSGIQLVWWGWNDWRVWFVGADDNLRKIYHWRLRFGPLEIRRWV